MKKKIKDEDVVEIRGNEVTFKKRKKIVMRIPLEDFVKRFAWDQSRSVFSDGSAIPEQVRFIQIRGNAIIVVIELLPQVRQVRWVSPDSVIQFGEGTEYQSVNLAFPFIVILTLFNNGNLCNIHQLFYRTLPLSSEQDELFLPQILNVGPAYGYLSFFCCKVGIISGVRMGFQIQRLIELFWEAGWNGSMDSHGTYWERIRKENLDPRIRSLEAWQSATEKNPLFMLEIPWRSAGATLHEVIEDMFIKAGGSGAIKTASDLITRWNRAKSFVDRF